MWVKLLLLQSFLLFFAESLAQDFFISVPEPSRFCDLVIRKNIVHRSQITPSRQVVRIATPRDLADQWGSRTDPTAYRLDVLYERDQVQLLTEVRQILSPGRPMELEIFQFEGAEAALELTRLIEIEQIGIADLRDSGYPFQRRLVIDYSGRREPKNIWFKVDHEVRDESLGSTSLLRPSSTGSFIRTDRTFEQQAKIYLPHLGTPVSGKVLELGCGGGSLVTGLRERGIEAYGVDLLLDPDQIVAPEIFRAADVARTGFPDRTFHTVLSFWSEFSYVFREEHVPTPAERAHVVSTLTEIYRVLRPGGVALLMPLENGERFLPLLSAVPGLRIKRQVNGPPGDRRGVLLERVDWN